MRGGELMTALVEGLILVSQCGLGVCIRGLVTLRRNSAEHAICLSFTHILSLCDAICRVVTWSSLEVTSLSPHLGLSVSNL